VNEKSGENKGGKSEFIFEFENRVSEKVGEEMEKNGGL
jgi:hypothetical protein